MAPLRVSGQSISSSINIALVIINTEMVAKQLLGLADLTEAQSFRIHEPTKVIMIDEHQNLVLAVF